MKRTNRLSWWSVASLAAGVVLGGLSSAGASQLPPPDLQVRIVGTANFQGRFTALVEDRATRTDSFYRVGDMIYGHRITDITAAGMTLEKDGRSFFLPMDASAGSGSPAAAPSRQAAAPAAQSSARQTASQPTQPPQTVAAPNNERRTFQGGQPARPERSGTNSPLPQLQRANAGNAQMASAIRANPALQKNIASNNGHSAIGSRPQATTANGTTIWTNGRPVAAAVASATSPRLAQPTTMQWEDSRGLTSANNTARNQAALPNMDRPVAVASNPSPNFYAESTSYRGSADLNRPAFRATTVARNADEQRLLAAAMTPGGNAATRRPNNGQPLALPRTATNTPQRGGIMTAAASPFRVAGNVFGGRSGNRAPNFVLPVADYSRMSSGFGYRRHPIGGGTRMHNGIDLAARPGTRIFAAAPGVVTWSGWKGGYGYCIIIDHKNGYQTLYGHCSRLVADVGDRVRAGEFIATVGSTGASTGPHLHFEVIRNGTPVDPMPYLPMIR